MIKIVSMFPHGMKQHELGANAVEEKVRTMSSIRIQQRKPTYTADIDHRRRLQKCGACTTSIMCNLFFDIYQFLQ